MGRALKTLNNKIFHYTGILVVNALRFGHVDANRVPTVSRTAVAELRLRVVNWNLNARSSFFLAALCPTAIDIHYYWFCVNKIDEHNGPWLAAAVLDVLGRQHEKHIRKKELKTNANTDPNNARSHSLFTSTFNDWKNNCWPIWSLLLLERTAPMTTNDRRIGL